MRTLHARPASWTALALPEPVSAVAADGAVLTAALLGGVLLRSLDGGRTWAAFAETTGLPTALLPVPDGLLVGTADGVRRIDSRSGPSGDGGPVRSGDGGAEGAPRGVVTALAARGDVTVLGLLRAGVYRSDDGGRRWEATHAGLPQEGMHLHVFAAVPARDDLVIAHSLGVSRSRDGGRTWTAADAGLPFQMPFATLAADGPTLYAGVNGRLYRAEPAPEGAVTWSEVYDGTADGRPLDLLGSDDGILYAATHTAPHLVASADGGASWASVAHGFPSPPVGFAVGTAWLVGLAWDGTLWRAPRLRGADGAPPAGALSLAVEAAETDAPVRLVFTLGTPAPVRLTVHDLLDREVTCIVDGPRTAGRHVVDLAPGTLPPGLYRCRLSAGGRRHTAPFAVLG